MGVVPSGAAPAVSKTGEIRLDRWRTEMTTQSLDQSFVTDGRIELARNYADALAQKHPSYSGSECAEKAVRKIFGRWLLDHTAAVRPSCTAGR